MSSTLRLFWDRLWEKEADRIDRQRILLDFLWHTPIPTDEAIAVISNNPSAVRQRDENDNFPIHVAVSNSAELAVIQALVEAWPRGLSIVTARDYETPLHLACLRNLSVECVACLAEAYPRALKMANRQNDLPLHLACRQHPQQRTVIEYLVNACPDTLIKKGKKGACPLHVALASRASLPVVQVLTSAETSSMQNREGDTAVHIAVANDFDLSVLLHLLESATPESLVLTNTKHGDTPLHVACRTRGRNLATIQVLAEANRQALVVRNKEEKTPLEVAQKSGADTEIIEWMSHLHYSDDSS